MTDFEKELMETALIRNAYLNDIANQLYWQNMQQYGCEAGRPPELLAWRLEEVGFADDDC